MTAEDYDTVLDPALDAARAAGKVRMLYLLGERFESFTAGAALEDTKAGLGHLGSWERIAVVTDHDWLAHAVRAFGWMIPGDVRAFATAELDAAKVWLAG